MDNKKICLNKDQKFVELLKDKSKQTGKKTTNFYLRSVKLTKSIYSKYWKNIHNEGDITTKNTQSNKRLC